MGLFGLFATMVSGGILFADTCNTAAIERQSREQAEREGHSVWVDNKGNYRLVGTNEKCFMHGDKLLSVKDGRTVIDYKQERIKKQNAKAIAEAKAEDKKYAYLMYPEISTDNRVRYLTEIETGRRYYLTHSRFTKKFIKGYYGNHAGIGTLLNKREDERIELTEEEYKTWGGYTFQEETGVYHEGLRGEVLV